MPGDLAYKGDGTGAMFSVGETPWHREGAVLTDPPECVEEALRLAVADFDVALQPVFVEGPWRVVPGHRATYRTDNGEVLGIVGPTYTPLQNRDAFYVLEPLLDAGKATLETAGVLRSGKDVWVLVRFDLKDPVVQEVFADEVVPFGLLSNNHTGERGVILQETPIRVVCANTLGAAHRTAKDGRTFRVRHTLRVELRTIEAAQRLWRALIERYRVVAEQYRTLKCCYLPENTFRDLALDVVAPIQPHWLDPKITKGQQKALERALARRSRIQLLWTDGKGQEGDNSAWEAYNAVVESMDHDEDLWPSRESRLGSLYDGHLCGAKRRVLDGLLDHALGREQDAGQLH